MDFILFVWTTDLFDFRISLIFLVELLIYHSFRLQNLYDYRIAFPLPRQGVVNSLRAFAPFRQRVGDTCVKLKKTNIRIKVKK